MSKLNIVGFFLLMFVAIALMLPGQYTPPPPHVAVTGSITSAQILALNSTPVQVVAAPGAGNAIIVDQFTAELVYNSVAYTNSSQFYLGYGTSNGGFASSPACPLYFITASANEICIGAPNSTATAAANVANKALSLMNTGANATGNSPITYWIWYHVLSGL